MVMLPVLTGLSFLSRNVHAVLMFKFSMSFFLVTSVESLLKVRLVRINDQMRDHSVINCIPFISELSIVRYWK